MIILVALNFSLLLYTLYFCFCFVFSFFYLGFLFVDCLFFIRFVSFFVCFLFCFLALVAERGLIFAFTMGGHWGRVWVRIGMVYSIYKI